ncbi:MAG: o-succinylbenzoate--CoA ligase [Candidatus Marinimicrobia bacterium]|nr:o-succinylbenzoate--CoA ligase [Candidatus Neomarinimicrobiota bacterium]
MSYSTKTKPIQQHPLFDAAVQYPSNIALRMGKTSLTFSDLYLQAMQMATGFSRRGIQPGQRVALGVLPAIEMIISIWACMLANIIVFPLNVRFPRASILEILADVKPALTLSTMAYPHFATMTFAELQQEAEQMDPVDPPPFKVTDATSLLMTSGSSGRVKFVQHSHQNHIQSALGSSQNIPLGLSDRWLLSLPLYHIGGLSIMFRTVLAGAALIIPEEKHSTLRDIELQDITHVSLVATQLQRFLRDESGPGILSGMKAILLGGSAIPHSLIQKSLEYALPIHVSYGSTEMASQIATTSGDHRDAALAGSGKVLPGRELIISHEGEILVKGETLAQGYLENRQLIELRDEDGWFHTGDVGYVNVWGELTVTGRMDNQFISGGENVQPEHIERILCKIPGILSAMVIPQADDEFGSRPVAYLEVSPTVPTGEEINQKLRNSLPGYMLPIAYYELPRELIDKHLKISRQDLLKMTYSGNKHLHSL